MYFATCILLTSHIMDACVCVCVRERERENLQFSAKTEQDNLPHNKKAMAIYVP